MSSQNGRYQVREPAHVQFEAESCTGTSNSPSLRVRCPSAANMFLPGAGCLKCQREDWIWSQTEHPTSVYTVLSVQQETSVSCRCVLRPISQARHLIVWKSGFWIRSASAALRRNDQTWSSNIRKEKQTTAKYHIFRAWPVGSMGGWQWFPCRSWMAKSDITTATRKRSVRRGANQRQDASQKTLKNQRSDGKK